jgi:exodeoxyribonuclease VII large subunit
MCRRLSRRLQQQQQHLHLCRSRLLLLSPRRSLRPLRLHLKHLAQRLEPAWRRRQQQLRRHLEYCLSHLQKLDPQAILGRGYAIATRLPENTVILDALEIPPETRVRVRVARGRLDCRVLETAEEKDRP